MSPLDVGIEVEFNVELLSVYVLECTFRRDGWFRKTLLSLSVISENFSSFVDLTEVIERELSSLN